MKFSAQFAKTAWLGLTAMLGLALAPAASAAATLKADYQFQDARTSAVAGAAALTDVIGLNPDNGSANGANAFATETVDGASRRVLTFPRGNGLALTPTTGLVAGNSYSVVILFRFANVDNGRRVMNVKVGSGLDTGLYIINGVLNYFRPSVGSATPTPVATNTYVQVAFTRDGTSTKLAGYVDGTPEWLIDDWADPGYNAMIANNVLHFFKDDTSGEESAGAVARIRVYDGALTATEVAALDRLPSACPAIALSPVTLPNGTVGTAYNQTISASGGTAPYTFAKSAGTLPTSLTLASGGVLSGTPTAAGTFNFTVQASDDNDCTGSKAYTVTIAGSGGGGSGASVVAWGTNSSGALGAGSTTTSNVPVAVDTSGVLAGKTVTAIASGHNHGLALASDGKVYSWGANNVGQLGNGSGGNNSTGFDSNVPVAVVASGVLAGKTVTAIAAGHVHSLAVTSDGKAYAWGDNTFGELGNGSSAAASNVPAAVDMSGVLAVKTVTAMAGGSTHSLALASDGKVYAWGNNTYGQLGTGNNTASNVPVAVSTSGVLAGKTVTAIAAGLYHSLAVTSDGKVYAWGSNGRGELGNASTCSPAPCGSNVPVAVNMSGVLAGKTVTAVGAGWYYSLAVTSAGKAYAWGGNLYGVLGIGSDLDSSNVPVAVDMSGVLAGKTVTAIAGYVAHSLALTSEGKAYGWGYGGSGEFGDGSSGGSNTSNVPVAVNTTGVLSGKTVTAIAAGSYHNLALASGGTGGECGTDQPSGLVGWWKAEGNANDSKGIKHGTVQPAGDPSPLTYVAGKVGQAFSLDGSNDAVLTPTINVGSTFTLEFWVFPKRSVASQHLVSNDYRSANMGALWLVNDFVEYKQGGVTRILSPTGKVPVNTWTHIALTYDGSVARLYINGALEGTSAAHAETFNNALRFGQQTGADDGVAYLFGLLDEISLYRRALAQAEIQTIVDAGAGGKCTTVACPTLTLSPATLPNGIVGTAYSKTITASGGRAPYSFTKAAGTLPAGLTLSSAGVLSGTLTTAGVANFTIRATDADGCTGSRAYTVRTCAAMTLSPATLPTGIVGTAYSKTITASGGTAPYSFAKTAGTLPTNLTLSSAGVLSGTPTATGTFSFTITATDANGCTGSRAYTVASVVCGAPPSGMVGWWPGQGNAKDVSRGGHHGTVTNITYAAGKVGTAFVFNDQPDGNGHLKSFGTVTIPDAPALRPAKFTLETWVKFDAMEPPGVQTNDFPLVGKPFGPDPFYLGSCSFFLACRRTTSNDVFRFVACSSQGGGFALESPANPAITTGKFYHVVATYDGSTARLYVDGVQVSSLTATITVAYDGNPIYFGNFNGVFPGHPFQGQLDEVTLYNRALTAAEVKGLFKADIAGKCPLPPCPTITLAPSTLPNGKAGTAYSQTLTAAGGTAPSNFARSAGALPNGLTLASSGLLAGTPTAAGNFSFTVTATDAQGCTGSRTYALTIGAVLSIDDVTVNEGHSGTTNASFTVSLSAASNQPVTVAYATSDGTATAGSDYTTTSGTLTFNPGQLNRTVSVPIVGDIKDEANETFKVNLTNASGAGIADDLGVGTIKDDDAAPRCFINDVSVTEADTTQVAATFHLTLSAASNRTVTVTYKTADGTALAGTDYVAHPSTTLTFNPGETSQTIVVQVQGDTLDEGNETFKVVLQSATNGAIVDDKGVGSITDNDPLPSLKISDASALNEGNAGTTHNALFVVTLTGATGRTVTVNYATSNGTATAGSDYTAATGTLTFSPGQTSKTLPIQVKGDAAVEPNENFKVNLSGATFATIIDSQGLHTITKDDGSE